MNKSSGRKIRATACNGDWGALVGKKSIKPIRPISTPIQVSLYQNEFVQGTWSSKSLAGFGKNWFEQRSVKQIRGGSMNLSRENVKTLVLWFFVDHGKFPPGTNKENWEAVKMSEMQWDDPPLPSDSNFEKRKLAQLLQIQFNSMGLKIKSPLETMKKKQNTMKDLWEFCFSNMEDMEVI